ncbi:MAG: adenosylhomocysteinase [bacterium]
MDYDITNLGLKEKGRLRAEWADNQMSVLSIIKERFLKEKPFSGIKIACCLHVTSETANLCKTLKAGGADVLLCASNPLSTQDDIAAYLVSLGIPVFAKCGEDNKTYYSHINACLDKKPNITMDDGADLVSVIHKERQNLVENIIGGSEETTTGVIRLRSLEKNKLLLYPIIAVNDAQTKHFFDNRYGTGQSTIDGILRATNRLLCGSRFVICGYGWCGRGLSMRARGMGANVIIVERDPLKALEAVMDGYSVMPIMEASKIGDIFITVTGNINVIRKEHFSVMKDNVILANTGHFNVEIDIPALEGLSVEKRKIRDFVDEYTLQDGRKINLLGDGRLINLVSAEGHPSSVMDMSFANQALACEFLVKNKGKLEKRVYDVPLEQDKEIARLKLLSLGVSIDNLTEEQISYLSDWEKGT